LNKKRNVIVGAGMAGLTAAAYLAREGCDVLLLDKNDRVGGLVNTFNQNGFVFDAGPRAFVNSGMVKPILKDLGIEWDFLENKISIGIEDQLVFIDSLNALMAYEQILAELYPENKKDIEDIRSAINRLSKYTKILYEFENPNFIDLTSDKKYIFKELLPGTIKLLFALRKLNQFNMPMEEFFKKITDNQSLIDILIQHFFKKTPAHFALGYFYVYLDYFYPKNGTGVLPRLLEKKILDWGGEIFLNKHIVEVIPSESAVVDSEGKKYSYDHLIWAADLKTFHRNLNTSGLRPETTDKIHSESQRFFSSKGAESSFILFLGVDRPPSYFKAKGGEHMFYTPSREGLGRTNQDDLQNLIESFEIRTKSEVITWLEKFISLNTYEVSIPVLRDSSLAPKNQTGVMISCLFDFALIKKIEKAGWLDEFRQLMENQIIRIFSQTIYAGFEKDILLKFSSTPLTINKVSGSSEGAITGWSFETQIPVKNTLTEIPKSVLTPVPGVLKAGQWAYSPSGVPIAMLTGWHAAQEIIKESKRK